MKISFVLKIGDNFYSISEYFIFAQEPEIGSKFTFAEGPEFDFAINEDDIGFYEVLQRTVFTSIAKAYSLWYDEDGQPEVVLNVLISPIVDHKPLIRDVFKNYHLGAIDNSKYWQDVF